MLTGDTNPIRWIQKKKHVDPYAALEGNTDELRTVVDEEIQRWRTVEKPDYETWFQEYTTMLEKALPLEERFAQVQNGSVSIQYTYGHRKNVWINGELVFKDIHEFQESKNYYVVIQDVGDGAETYEISVYSKALKQLWNRSPVGPTCAIDDGNLYYQTPIHRLRYNKVKLCKLATGKQERVVYIETNPKYNTEILQPPYQDAIFIKSANALSQKLERIEGAEVKRVFHTESTIVPVQSGVWATNTMLHPYGQLPKDQYIVDAIVHNSFHYLITVRHGHHTLWKFKDRYEKIIDAPSIRFLKEANDPTVSLKYHYQSSQVYDIHSKKITLEMPSLLSLSHDEGTFEGIPYTIVWKQRTTPKALIVSAYGAYGIEAQREYPIRWLPWIERGFAFAVVMPRGGRDNGDQWYDEGRTAPRKHRTFDDTAKAIAHLQKELKIPPLKTLFYGRSAGGWVSAMIALQHSTLVRGVIAEVPYVDVLRTTSNPKLPLTTLEYDEFGDPLHKQQDYEALLKISPVDLARKVKPQNTVVLLKTALHDSQVATYESLKLAATLREKGWTNVYVNIDEDGGHFVGRERMAHEYAEDAAFYSNFVWTAPDRRRWRTRKASNHLSKGTTRRRTSSSKHAISTTTSPSAV